MRDQTHLCRAVRAKHAGAPRRGVTRLHAGSSGREHAAHTARGQSGNSSTLVRFSQHPGTISAVRLTMDAGSLGSVVCETLDADPREAMRDALDASSNGRFPDDSDRRTKLGGLAVFSPRTPTPFCNCTVPRTPTP
jgi:hypothetical protein